MRMFQNEQSLPELSIIDSKYVLQLRTIGRRLIFR